MLLTKQIDWDRIGVVHINPLIYFYRHFFVEGTKDLKFIVLVREMERFS